MNRFLTILALVFVMLAGVQRAKAQQVGIKTNLLYDATSTINLGAEIELTRKLTLDVSGNYNPWEFSGYRKMKHWMIQPEVRWWLCESFNGTFFGIHAHGGQFNFGGMLPWGFKDGKMFGIENKNISTYRYEGWLAGAGLAVGHQWMLSSRWSLEAELGLGYAYLKYDKYMCKTCGKKLGSAHKNYVGPTKVAVSLIYFLK